MDANERRDVVVTCGPGLKDYLRAELEELGFKIVDSTSGGVVTRGSFTECMKLNLLLRTAYSVLYLLREFRCGTAEALYKQVGLIPWESIIDPAEYLCVLSRVDTRSINNTMYPNLKVKDAIVDRLVKKTSRRCDSGPDRNGVVVNLYWKDDRAWLYLNTSGVKLSDRNYRKMPHKAPLRESLAAALIMASGYNGSRALVLPMCGSGTLAIEAAMIAMNKPAALLRSNFGFKHIKIFDERAWKQIRTAARKAERSANLRARIVATDIDQEAIDAAKQNARTAGVDHLIDFVVCDFIETHIPEGEGIILMNPEYGLRLGKPTDLEALYKRIGDFLKQRCPGYTGYVFTGNMQLAKRIGLKASRRLTFYNGNIECRLLKYELYEGTRK
jgi:putative N6-adenine-specific DNA methylase